MASRNEENSVHRSVVESAFLAHRKCLKTLYEGRCDRQCENCLLNVKKYGLTPEEETSVMFRARDLFELERKEERESSTQGTIDLVIFLVIAGLLLFGFFKACSFTKSIFAPSWNRVPEVSKYEPIEQYIPIPKNLAQKDGAKFFASLVKYLDFIRENIYDIIDDGKINCMDYAVYYLLVAEDTAKIGGSVRIFANDAIDHVFIGVVIDDKWFFFDPQARRLEDTPMLVFWASDYRTYDPNLTDRKSVV